MTSTASSGGIVLSTSFITEDGFIRPPFSLAVLTTYCAGTLRFGSYGPNNHIIPLFQLPIKQRSDFCVRMICDSKRHLHRFDGVVPMKLPNYGSVGFGRARQILRTRPWPGACRVICCLCPFTALNSILFVTGQKFLHRYWRLISQGRVWQLQYISDGGDRNGHVRSHTGK